MTPQELRDVDRVILTGCGTAYHAGLVGEYLIESLAHLPCEVEFASEFRYRNMPMDKDTLVVAVSQSGETIDTLAAVRESLRKGHRTLGMCNNVASTIARECGAGVYMHAGPGDWRGGDEIVHLATDGVHVAGAAARAHPPPVEQRRVEDHQGTPGDPGPNRARARTERPHPGDRREVRAARRACFSWGGSITIPVALEGALKMKEITYIQCEGHPSAELKHGFIALVEPDMPSIFIAPDDAMFDSNLNSIEQVKARRGPVIAIGTEGRKEPGEDRGRRHLHPALPGLPVAAADGDPAAAAFRISHWPSTWAATWTSRATSPRA